MRNILIIFFTALAAFISGVASAEPVRIGGNGTFSAFMAEMARRYQLVNPSAQVVVTLPPLSSSGGVRALSGGDLDIAGGIRAMNAQERAMPNIGGERRLGTTPFVLVSSHPGARPFSMKDLAGVYAGEIKTWPDASPIRLILRARTEGVTAFMRALSPEINAAIDASFERKGMVIAENDLDTMALAERTPGSLAPSSLLLARLEKRRLTVLPFENAGAGAHLQLWMTTSKTLRPEVADFLAFIESDGAKAHMIELGFAPYGP